MTTKCDGNSDDHCCYLNGKVCQYLNEYPDQPRRWSCGLYEKYHSWDAVYESIEYEENVQPEWDIMIDNAKINYPSKPDDQITKRCGDFPLPGQTCATCGKTG